MNRMLTILPVIFLSACSVLPEQAAVDLYQLPPPRIAAAATNSELSGLRIARPLSNEALSSNRLLIMPVENQFQAFAGMRLTATVPSLWRDLLLDGFRQDGRITGISAASEGLQGELELGGMLTAFHVDSTGSRAEAVIQYDAHLININNRQIVASQRFTGREMLSSIDAPSAVGALGSAANDLLPELIQWVIDNGQ